VTGTLATRISGARIFLTGTFSAGGFAAGGRVFRRRRVLRRRRALKRRRAALQGGIAWRGRLLARALTQAPTWTLIRAMTWMWALMRAAREALAPRKLFRFDKLGAIFGRTGPARRVFGTKRRPQALTWVRHHTQCLVRIKTDHDPPTVVSSRWVFLLVRSFSADRVYFQLSSQWGSLLHTRFRRW
jgi:hypothetical protein